MIEFFQKYWVLQEHQHSEKLFTRIQSFTLKLEKFKMLLLYIWIFSTKFIDVIIFLWQEAAFSRNYPSLEEIKVDKNVTKIKTQLQRLSLWPWISKCVMSPFVVKQVAAVILSNQPQLLTTVETQVAVMFKKKTWW